MAAKQDTIISTIERRRWRIAGQVQGVGFRPFVYRLAQRYRLSGFVRNDSQGVAIEAQGAVERLERFAKDLAGRPPARAVVDRVETQTTSRRDDEADFVILASESDTHPRAGLAVDTAVCTECLAEMSGLFGSSISIWVDHCTNCGPRYTIVHRVPYDRPNTTMAKFEMCGPCRSEYTNPSDRRFHAQPIACHGCGPRVDLVDPRGRAMAGDPIDHAASLLAQGKIVAIKGLGGFHLAVRADDSAAVARLRCLKGRDVKPLAVMCATVDNALDHVRASQPAIEALQSPPAPIVLASVGHRRPRWAMSPRRTTGWG